MALGFFEGVLTKGALTALPYISSLVEDEISANEILRQIRAAGLSVRRSQGLSIIRHLRGIKSTRSYVNSLKLNVLPNVDRLPKPITATLRDFSYKVRYKVINTLTGEAETIYRTLSTNDLLTKQAALDELAPVFDEYPAKYPYQVIEQMIYEITSQQL